MVTRFTSSMQIRRLSKIGDPLEIFWRIVIPCISMVKLYTSWKKINDDIYCRYRDTFWFFFNLIKYLISISIASWICEIVCLPEYDFDYIFILIDKIFIKSTSVKLGKLRAICKYNDKCNTFIWDVWILQRYFMLTCLLIHLYLGLVAFNIHSFQCSELTIW